MKSKYLFPAWCGVVGYPLAIPGFVLGYLFIFNKYQIPGFGFNLREKNRHIIYPTFENFTNELAIFLVIIGLVLINFSKSKKEDELSAKLRLNALYWSTMLYYLLHVLSLFYTEIVGEIPFIGDHIFELNLVTPLVIFLIRYNYLKYFNKESYFIGQPKFLPNRPARNIGRILCLPCLGFFILVLITNAQLQWIQTILPFTYVGFIIGFLLWGFSQNKIEDEMIMQQRLEGLQLAVYFNYSILLIATLLIYSLNFLTVLSIANFSLLLFFVIRMEYVNYKNNRILNTFEGEIGS